MSFSQSYFSYRIYRVGEKLCLPILCWFLSLLRLGAGLALAIESYFNVPHAQNAILVTRSFGWLITLVATIGAAVDVLIAASLCYYIKHLAPPNPSRRLRQLSSLLMLNNPFNNPIHSSSVGALVDRLMAWTIHVLLNYLTSLNVRQHEEESRSSVSKLVFTKDTPFEG
ncbi:hypothetical protein C0995_005596 [Termitomyces sp. Mi166|nr:hypothetical protein C0995_005596 [Termitomyces sp. Mi166\